MTTPKPIYEPESRAGQLEQEAALAGVAAADALRAVEVAAVVAIGLLVCPPLAILAVVVVVPLAAIALVLGLVVAVVTAPYLLFHHLRGRHGGHLPLLAHRLRHAARALADLAPHRVVAGARRAGSGR